MSSISIHIHHRAQCIMDAFATKFFSNRSEEHTSELQSHVNLVCRLLLEKKNKKDCANISGQPTPPHSRRSHHRYSSLRPFPALSFSTTHFTIPPPSLLRLFPSPPSVSSC